MRILNLGSCNIDYVYTVDHIVRAGETLPADGMEQFVGGKGLNQSVALANAGAVVYHAGCIGEDGKILKDYMESRNVKLDYLKITDGKSGQAIIQLDKNGENCIFLYAGANHLIDKPYIDEVLSHFDKGDFVLLQNEISNLEYIIDAAYERGLNIIFNPAPFTEELVRIPFKKLHTIILNEVECRGFSGDSAPEIFLNKMSKEYPQLNCVVTLGANGSIFSNGKEQYMQPAFKVKAVDTTAAGDTFVGFFLAAITSGSMPKRALELSSIAAALTVSKKGAAPSIPTIDEVMATDGKLAPLTVPNDFRDKAINYIRNTETPDLGELAARLGYTKSYTSRKISTEFGFNFSTLVLNYRCQKAANLFKNTQLSISEIIKQVGYENESFFRKKFHELYGMNPLEFRKMHRGDAH